MKSITNTLLIIFTSILAFMSGDSLIHTHPIKISCTDSTYLYTENKLDSIDKKITTLHEKTFASLEADYKVFQNTEKKLLYLDLCLDSIHNNGHMEDTNFCVLSPIK